MSKNKITIETTINENVEKVWDHHTNPEHIVKWNAANDDWYCPQAENDLRLGGKMKSRMEAKDGSFGFDFEATYDEVIPQQKTAYNDRRQTGIQHLHRSRRKNSTDGCV